MDFKVSPDSLNGLGISGNNWFRRFTLIYIHVATLLSSFYVQFLMQSSLMDQSLLTIQ